MKMSARVRSKKVKICFAARPTWKLSVHCSHMQTINAWISERSNDTRVPTSRYEWILADVGWHRTDRNRAHLSAPPMSYPFECEGDLQWLTTAENSNANAFCTLRLYFKRNKSLPSRHCFNLSNARWGASILFGSMSQTTQSSNNQFLWFRKMWFLFAVCSIAPKQCVHQDLNYASCAAITWDESLCLQIFSNALTWK